MSLETHILTAEVSFLNQSLLRPLVISSGAIRELTEARVQVRVRVHGREAVGKGSIYLSDLWSWPDPALSHEHRDRVLRARCQRIAQDLPALCGGGAAHPLELGLRLHEHVCQPENSPLPALAEAMCLSPFDAAIHDAAGVALGRSAFGFYDEPAAIPSADRWFTGGSAAPAIRYMLRAEPLRALPAWVLVGKYDDLEKDVRPWARDRGYRCLKIKILGKDNAEDVARTVEVYRAARRWDVPDPWLSVDSNEGNADAASVLDYLLRLRNADAEAFAALRYLEQPTGRDILRHRYDWRPITQLKPVLLDEGLTSLELLEEARSQGWSGLAIKTCKGHSFALVAAAWAHERNMPLALQDLTNPGYSAVHAALFAAFVPTINGVELNSPQFTPAANAPWLPRLAGLFEPRNGLHELPRTVAPGLGSCL